MIVKEAMWSNVQCAFPEVPISLVARIMRESRLRCIPVVTNDELLGMITEEQVSRHTAAQDELGSNDVTAGDIMIRGAFFCFEDEELEKAALIMRKKKVHHLVVLDRHRIARVVGVVSADAICAGEKTLLSPA